MVRPNVVLALSSQLRESIQIISQKRITYPSTPLLFVIPEPGVEIALQMAVLLWVVLHSKLKKVETRVGSESAATLFIDGVLR